MRLKCVSINICGLGSPSKCYLVSSELSQLKYDIFLLQETHVSCKEKTDKFAGLCRGKCYWPFGTGKSAGVAILTSPNFQGKVSCFVFDSHGRILSILIQLGNSSFNIVNIYSPNTVSDRKVFFERLHDYFFSRLLSIGSDFNCVDNSIDKFYSSNVHYIDKASLCSLKSVFSLVDVWHKHNPRVASFTWSNSSGTQASRLDRLFLNRFLAAVRVKFLLAFFLIMILFILSLFQTVQIAIKQRNQVKLASDTNVQPFFLSAGVD